MTKYVLLFVFLGLSGCNKGLSQYQQGCRDAIIEFAGELGVALPNDMIVNGCATLEKTHKEKK